MTLANRFAKAAEDLVGTRFVEHGRNPDVGLDCAGLVIVAASRAGIEFADRPYALVRGADHYAAMIGAIEEKAELLPSREEWQRGDILAIRFGPLRNHLAVYLGRTLMVHAYRKTGVDRVVVTPLDPAHERMVKAAYRLRDTA